MAASNVKVGITVEGLDKFRAALKELSDSGAIAAAVVKGMSGAMANSLKNANFVMGGDVGVVSRGEFEKLVNKFSRCSQRMSLLLSILSVDELKRLELLPPDAPSDSADGWDRVLILKALDAKVDQFNAAHQRLTGKRKKVPDPGRLELTQEEMARVLAAKQAGISTEKIVAEIKAQRAVTKTIRF